MTKTGRNQPCPCGSGKKYKRCCLARDQAARSEEAAHQQAVRREEAEREETARREALGLPGAVFLPDDDDLDQLDSRSNRVVDLIRNGRLDEAEDAANDLFERYPGFMDGHLRHAMICEARDQPEQAAVHYREAAGCLDDDCDELRSDFLKRADELVAETP